MLFDLMPTDPAVLGFSNPWYPDAVKTATRVRLSDRVEIRVISGPAFLATKLEVFIGRGDSDPLSSHDLEDILNVVDGRPSIVEELRTASDVLRKFVREQFTGSGGEHTDQTVCVVGRRRRDPDILHVETIFAMQLRSQARQSFDIVIRRLSSDGKEIDIGCFAANSVLLRDDPGDAARLEL